MNASNCPFQGIHEVETDGETLLPEKPIDLERTDAFHVREGPNFDTGKPSCRHGAQVEFPRDGGIGTDDPASGWTQIPGRTSWCGHGVPELLFEDSAWCGACA